MKKETNREVLVDSKLLKKNGLAPPTLVRLGKKLNMEKIPITLKETVKQLQKE